MSRLILCLCLQVNVSVLFQVFLLFFDSHMSFVELDEALLGDSFEEFFIDCDVLTAVAMTGLVFFTFYILLYSYCKTADLFQMPTIWKCHQVLVSNCSLSVAVTRISNSNASTRSLVQ